jgi:Tol biopolymer transport system component/tRNA A-37 threonylcarbamoyl transferase component Bud32
VTDPLSRLSAALADRYRIERELGQGGMATVYLAEDLKHDRKVALKVLKPELAAVLGAERFVVEIKTTAALQHPHILPLFDSGAADGFLYYVMPFIDGETLRSKLDRETQLGIEEAVKIASDVADALDYAHRHGVIHRDIKPENILLHDGRPMVADFGIALALSAAAGGRMTETGLSLGTPHYMSPEQATAEKDISARSDVYSLASVLYEMLAGQPPHLGGSAQQIIMKIVTDVPRPVTELRKSVPPNVAAAVAKALERLPADRFDSARAFREALTSPHFVATTGAAGTTGAGRPGRRVITLAGWALAALMTVALGWSVVSRGAGAPEPSIRFAFSLGNATSADVAIAISPDGRQIIQQQMAGSRNVGLAVRDLGLLEPRVLAVTGYRATVSPDGRWIAYSGNAEVWKVPVDGGTPIELARCVDPVWEDMDTLICLAPNWGLGRFPSSGGVVEQLTVPDTAAGEIGHWAPDPLPGGKAVLFTSYRRPVSRIEAIDLTTGRRQVVVENAFFARYARSGHVLFVRDSALFAIRFDPATLRTEGSPVPVLDDVASRPSDARAGVAISENGTLAVLRQSEWQVDTRVVWVGRDGREAPAIQSPGAYSGPRLSPDGSRILLTVGRGRYNLWVYDLRRDLLTQLTRSPGTSFRGVWTPDGRQVVFTNETPSYDVYRVPVDGSSGPVEVISNVRDKYPGSISPDGKSVVYEESWAGNVRIRVASLDGSGPGRVVGDSTIQLYDPRYSPDGRWMAVTGVMGTAEVPHIYVLRSDGTGGALQVSAGEMGESDPRWTRGGRELVFRRGSAVYAASIDPATGEVGRAQELFDGGYPSGLGYDVTADGNRFLMVKPVSRPEALPILVITNFFEELRRKVGQ